MDFGLRLEELRNRVEEEAVGRLANVGWTDEARIASLAVRQAKAMARPAESTGSDGAGEVSASPQGFAPDRSPPREGTIVNMGGSICVMRSGKFVRIGSTKVLCVLPDGRLAIKVGRWAYPLGKTTDWGPDVNALFLVKGPDGKFYVDCGKALLSLDDGKVLVKKNYTPRVGRIVIRQGYPFSHGGVAIPPDPPDISRRRDIQT